MSAPPIAGTAPAPTRSARRPGRGPGGLPTVLLPLGSLVALIGIWWLACVLLGIRSFLVPKPPEVVSAFMRIPRYMLVQTWITAEETLTGFAIAVVAGFALATLLASSRWIEQALMPLLVALNAVPKLAIAPLLTVWLGFELLPKIVMVIMLSIFPIVVATATGLTSTPAEFGELASSMSASRWKTFVKVRVPWALPDIFVGLKLAITLAVIGAVVGEFAGADHGLGFVIVNSGQQADTALAFASIVLLALFSNALFYLVVVAELILLPWKRQTSI